MIDMNRYITVCGDFDYTAKQSIDDYSFVIVDRRTQKCTRTDDCIMEVKRNPSAYVWEDFVEANCLAVKYAR